MLAFFMSVLWCLLFTFHDGLSSPAMVKPTTRPIYSQRPFGFVDQRLTIFYKERLGYYPYYNKNNVPFYDSVPQNASISIHLRWMQEALKKYINKMGDEEGLAVNWEEWRPIWLKNWHNKDVYRQFLWNLVAAHHPAWPLEDVNKQAQFEFETAAHNFMEQTLQHARSARPHQLWCVYLFFNFYNHDYMQNWERYTWNTALFRSIYLIQTLESSSQGRMFVHFQVKEAMRIANKHHKDYTLPVYVYSRPTYMKIMDTLSQMDLVSSIGKCAAQRASRVIFWGDVECAENVKSCLKVKSYLEGSFGEYIVNVTTAAGFCSRFLCNRKSQYKHNSNTGTIHSDTGVTIGVAGDAVAPGPRSLRGP
ncbi:hypothetical protein GDO78_000287 [Eleutherodactylus coqui]|uniref:Hyaluronidase n=1 Tax=Eleutherodactylus coqui TaxID=57060 RepID=A0A8J6FRX1_ELECQ|nr:hypothetical protein GDO78_000287 [Eleutherodactylus coqui]